MIGRPSPAHVVIIHGREIVVNKRIGVDQLEPGRKRQHPSAIRSAFGPVELTGSSLWFAVGDEALVP